MKTLVISERKIRAIITTLEDLGLQSLTKELRKALRDKR